MKPPDDDDSISDDTQGELIAQIVPLRRRHDDTNCSEQPHDVARTTAQGTDDWSVFDPPEDLQLLGRPQPDHRGKPDYHDDFAGDDPERPWISTPRARHRLVAFAGVALTVLAIAVLAVLTLKGHVGASPRRAPAPTPNATLTSASRALSPKGGAPTLLHGRQTKLPSHRKLTKRRSSPHTPSHTVTADTPAGGEVTADRGSGEPTPTQAQSEPSSSDASSARGAASEFGIEP
jgi:hypothetical protein